MITFKQVSHTDMQDIYAWRNHLRNREYSGNAKELDFDDHMYWFDNEIEHSNSKFAIGYLGKMPLGVVRYAEDNSPLIYVISIYLVPGYHGMGIGELLLKASLEWFFDKFRTKPIIKAIIKSENMASIIIFERCGFKQVGDKWELR